MTRLLLLFSFLICSLYAFSVDETPSATIVNNGTTMKNGIITLTIGSNGRASNMRLSGYNQNILGSNGIYFDYTAAKNAALSPDKAEIIRQTDDMVEVLYSNTSADLRFQQGWILRKGVSGVYTYIIVNGTPTSSSVNVKEARVCTRLNSGFLNGYVDDVMQGRIPSNEEMAYAEKNTQTQDATYEMADGSVYTKYNWAQFIDSDLFHGLMNHKVGVWNIPVSYEWLNGGPMRQELTVHATGKSPITIQMLQGEHLGGAAQAYTDGERQIFGPFFIYVNTGESQAEMISDARREALAQKSQWPFQWFDNELYPLDRATVRGRIELTNHARPSSMKVVLAEPGKELIRQGKKYMFWTETAPDGSFVIPNVRKGDYAIYAYALDGDITDEYQLADISVDTDDVDLGTLEWTPDVYENLLWIIGSNNRRSDGYKISGLPRAYGLWNDVPANISFTPGSSDPQEEWYYAQAKNGTWTVNFNLDEEYTGNVHLTASCAGSTNKPKVAVGVNGVDRTTWSFPNNDAAIYRSANQAGRHCVKIATFPATDLKKGLNQITLKMSGISKNGGVMYDCIKLEAGEKVSQSVIDDIDMDASSLPIDLFNLQGIHVATVSSFREVSLPAGIYLYRQGSRTGKIRL